MKQYIENNSVKSVQGEQFILAYSIYMGKLEELELNLFHLNKPLIKPNGKNYWVRVSLNDLSEWYDVVKGCYSKVCIEEVNINHYDWMLDNLSERIKTCLQKVSVCSFINKANK